MTDLHFSSTRSQIAGIQYLRGIAAIAVCIYHISGAQYQYFPKQTALIPAIYGLWGVDVFFVVSGFIMVCITAGLPASRNNTWRFWCNRITRIIPAYWFFTLATFVLILVLYKYNPAIKRNSIKELIQSLFFLKIDGFPVLMVGWTLNYEMFFYFIYGLVMAWSYQYRAQITSFIFLLLVTIGFAVKTKNPVFIFITNPIIIEFVIGMILGWLYSKKKMILSRYAHAIVAIATISIIASSTLLPERLLIDNRTLVSGIPAGLLVWGIVCLDINPGVKWLSTLGDISYSVYLSHLIIVGALVQVIKLHPIEGVNSNTLFILLSMPLVITASITSYKYIEVRLTRYLRKTVFSD